MAADCNSLPSQTYGNIYTVEDIPATTFNEGSQLALGVKVTVKTAGAFTAFRFYKTEHEHAETHVGKVYTWPQGRLVGATSPFTSCRGPTWVSTSIVGGVDAVPGQEYIIVLDGVTDYAKTEHFFNGHRPSSGQVVVIGGVYGLVVGQVPTGDDQLPSSYFIDCKS